MASTPQPHRQDERAVEDTREAHEEAVRPAREEAPDGAMAHALDTREPTVAGIDPTTLAQHIAHWTQMRALLTTYMRQHMHEGMDYYTLQKAGSPPNPPYPQPARKNS
jgi:hypothetical protein